MPSTPQFVSCIREHVEANKPDPLARRQIEALEVSWNDDEAPSRDGTEEEVRGTLTLTGEHATVALRVECIWTTNRSSIRISQRGALVAAKHPSKSSAGMAARLAKDYYVRQLLLPEKEEMLVAEATIRRASSELEERYRSSEEGLEALRLSLFSHSECNTSVLQFLLDMPWMPRTVLANRARLRLLEDAMVDACEKEGEDDLLEDLNISCKEDVRSDKKVRRS